MARHVAGRIRLACVRLATAVALCLLPSVVSASGLVAIDTPAPGATAQQPFLLSGWAIDPSSTAGPGIDAIHVWAYPNGSGPSVFVTAATPGSNGWNRPDVAVAYGPQFQYSGYGLLIRNLPPKMYTIVVYARSSVDGSWSQNTVNLNVTAQPYMSLDAPLNGAHLTQPFAIGGWAIDKAAAAGTGVSGLHFWATPIDGSPSRFLGSTAETGGYGGLRPDVGAAFGDARFTASGFNFTVTALPAGSYDLAAYAFSTVSGAFTLSESARIAVDTPPPAPTIDPPGGLFNEPQTVLITVPPGTQVRFTRNGTTPTVGSELYSGAFTLDGNAALRAVAFEAGFPPSTVSVADFNFVTGTPTPTPPGGTYVGALSITIQPATPSSAIYWTDNGTDPTQASTLYNGSISLPIGVTKTIKARAYRAGWTPSGVAAHTYVTTFATVADPVPTPESGSYQVGQQIMVSFEPGALVHYTMDGSEPVESSPVYFGPIVLTGPVTIRARAFRPQFSPSRIMPWTYTTQVATPTIPTAGGVFATMPVVTLQSTTTGATIRYTTDRTDPTDQSTAYTAPFVPPPNVTIRARSFLNGWTPSDIATETYLLESFAFASNASPGTAAPSNLNPLAFSTVNGSVTYAITGAIGPTSVSDVAMHVNGLAVPSAQIVAGGQSVAGVGVLREGLNEVEIVATDSAGLLIGESTRIWAGSRSLTVSVVDDANRAMSNVSVKAVLSADRNVSATGHTNSQGQVTLTNLPANQSVVLSAELAGYRFSEYEQSTGAGSTGFRLDVDNQDFSRGLLGWYAADWWTTRAYLLPHSEASQPFVPCGDCIGRSIAADVPADAAASGDVRAAASSSNDDLVVDTKNQIYPQTIVRTFSAAPGATAASLRYRFQSDEVVSGWGFNDWYLVSLKNLRTNRTVSESYGVANLRGQFDANGAIGWRTLTLPVEAPGDLIEVRIIVANAVDNAHMSLIWADFVQERAYRVSGVRLFDLIYPNDAAATFRRFKPLERLSVSAHPFYNGITKVHGTMRVTGPSADWITSVQVDVLENGVVRASGPWLSSTAAAALVGRPFGDGLSFGLDAFGAPVAATPLLLEIPSTALGGGVVQTSDGRVTMRLRIHTFAGIALPPVPIATELPKLVLYQGNNRVPGTARDEDQCTGLSTETAPARKWRSSPFPCGGDGWATPRVEAWARAIAGVRWNDFSNMHAGSFPYHQGHRNGDTMDGDFADGTYRDMGAAGAERMLQYLDLYGNQIERAYVSFALTADGSGYRQSELHLIPLTNKYWDAIRTVKLRDGRCARDVIQPKSGHGAHFDWMIVPTASIPAATATRGVCQ